MKTATLPDYLTVSESDGCLYDTRAPGWHTRAPLRAEYSRTFERIDTGRQFRATLRAGPWACRYPMALLCSDGGSLCFNCGRSEARQIIRAIRDESRNGWRIVGSFVHWEGAPIDCAHCGKGIPSAYGEPETVARDRVTRKMTAIIVTYSISGTPYTGASILYRGRAVHEFNAPDLGPILTFAKGYGFTHFRESASGRVHAMPDDVARYMELRAEGARRAHAEMLRTRYGIDLQSTEGAGQ